MLFLRSKADERPEVPVLALTHPLPCQGCLCTAKVSESAARLLAHLEPSQSGFALEIWSLAYNPMAFT